MMEAIEQLCCFEAKARVSGVAVPSDGQFVVAGASDGTIYTLDRSGVPLWQDHVEGSLFRLVIAEQAERILASSSDGKHAYVWDYEGHLLFQLSTAHAVWGLCATPDGELMIVGTTQGALSAYNATGELLWQHDVGSCIRRAAVTPDGERIALGTDSGNVYLFDRSGQQCWTYATGGSLWAGTLIPQSAEYVVAGANANLLHLLSLDGDHLWQRDTHGSVCALAVTPDAQSIACGSLGGTIQVFDVSGDLQWSYRAHNDVYSVSLSADGRFIAAGSFDHHLYIHDLSEPSDNIWMHQTNDKIYAVAMTPSGRLIAAGSYDRHLYLFENLAAVDAPMAESAAARRGWRARARIRQLRQVCAANPSLGLARWFEAFDRGLRDGDIETCALLLREVRGGGYEVRDGEWPYIESREAALDLCRGVIHHRQQEFEAAAHCFETSRQRNRQIANYAGEGQALAAQYYLQQGTAVTESGVAVLDGLLRAPRVIAGPEVLLARRLESGVVANQLGVIAAARQSGYLTPLLTALGSPEQAIQQAAAASLSRLDPGVDYPTLLEMLDSRHEFVCWQALLILHWRAKERKDELMAHHEALRQAVMKRLTTRRDAPAIRADAARLLTVLGSREDTPFCIDLLAEQSADVRRAAADALAIWGDRRALPALESAANGRDLNGLYISRQFALAATKIKERHPLPTVRAIALSSAPSMPRPAHSERLFLTDTSAIYCHMEIANPKADIAISIKWLHAGAVLAAIERPSIGDADEAEAAALGSSALADDTHPEGAGETPTGALSARARIQQLVQLLSASESSVGESSVGESSVGESSVGESSVGESSASESSAGESSEAAESSATAAETAPATASHAFILRRPAAGWAVGEYELHVILGNELVQRQTFRLTNALAIERLVPSASRVPTSPSRVVSSRAHCLYATVFLTDAPRGLPLRGRICHAATGEVLAESQQLTQGEGTYQETLTWSHVRLLPGAYRIVVSAGTWSEAEYPIQVVAQVVVGRPLMCKETDSTLRPRTVVERFAPHDTFLCAVELGPTPIHTRIHADWSDGQGNTIASTATRAHAAGRQQLVFRLTPPASGWKPGAYSVRVRVKQRAERVRFVVAPDRDSR